MSKVLMELSPSVLRKMPAQLRAKLEREYYALRISMRHIDDSIDLMNRSLTHIAELANRLPDIDPGDDHVGHDESIH